jgi:hypothetical protein
MKADRIILAILIVCLIALPSIASERCQDEKTVVDGAGRTVRIYPSAFYGWPNGFIRTILPIWILKHSTRHFTNNSCGCPIAEFISTRVKRPVKQAVGLALGIHHCFNDKIS